MPQTGVIILAHGSRGERGIVEVNATLRRVTAGVTPLLPRGVKVIGAALQFNHPNLEEAVETLALQGINRVVIMPYFLFSGRHITEHIPQLIEGLKSRYPGVQFTLANTMGNDELFIGLVARRLEEAAPEIWASVRASPTSPEDIERQSMEIAERFLPPAPNMSEDERLVVKRIIHASGDHQVAPLIKISPSAISSGLSPIDKGSPIFTDVRMVAAGINKRLAEACGCLVSCAMDEAKELEQTKETSITRAAAALRNLGKRLDGAIVVIGNAPTALMALLDLIDNSAVKPALVVGMPVGFVQAKESKDELMKREIPYITIVGTRGGSAMAVATINALLKMAVDRKEPD